MYTVTKGLNNNIVMARAEDGRECVLTGSGIGFRKSPGAPVLEQQIEHIYYGLDKLQEKWLYLLGSALLWHWLFHGLYYKRPSGAESSI